jgi:hypothetical protein
VYKEKSLGSSHGFSGLLHVSMSSPIFLMLSYFDQIILFFPSILHFYLQSFKSFAFKLKINSQKFIYIKFHFIFFYIYILCNYLYIYIYIYIYFLN